MLGVSVYIDKSSASEIKDYLKLASESGFKRVFTCLLSVDEEINVIKERFLDIITYAKNLGMLVIIDVSPRVFTKLNISYSDLSFFNELNADGIRLDESYNGKVESDMTFNEYNLMVELNMSQDVRYLETVIDYQPKMSNLLGCHNFYPQRYTGLSYEYFMNASKRFKENKVTTCAFVNSTEGKIGPWPLMQGLCTLEMHRDLDVVTQAKHLHCTGVIDDIIIGNQFASKKELVELGSLNPEYFEFRINISNNSKLENKILFEEIHFRRGDVNDYLIRSTQSRVKYKTDNFEKHDTKNKIEKGSIVIGNNDFGQYKGELQIVCKDIIDQEMARNVVGKIIDEEIFLIDFIKPWQKFKFKEME